MRPPPTQEEIDTAIAELKVPRPPPTPEEIKAAQLDNISAHPTDAMGLTNEFIRGTHADPAALQRAEDLLTVPEDAAEQVIAHVNAMKAVKTAQPQAREAVDYSPMIGKSPMVVAGDLPAVKGELKTAKLSLDLKSAPKVSQFIDGNDMLAASLQDDLPHLAWLERLDSGIPSPHLTDDERSGGTTTAPGPLPWTMRPEGAIVDGIGRAVFGTLANITKFMASIDLDPGMPPDVYRQRLEARAKYFSDLAGAEPIPAAKTPAGKVASTVSSLATGVLPFGVVGKAGIPATFSYMFVESYGSLRRQGVSEGSASLWAMAAALPAALLGEDFSKWLGGPQTLEEARSALSTAMQKLVTAPTLGAALKPLSKHAASGYAMNLSQSLVERTASMLAESNRTGKKIDPSEWVQAFGEVALETAKIIPFIGVLGLHEHYEARGRYFEAHANAATHDLFSHSVPEEIKGREDDYKAALRAVYDNARAARTLKGFRDVAEERGGDTGPWDEALRANEGKNKRYVDPTVFDSAVRSAGEDPEAWGAKAAGDDGSAFRNAKQAGTLFEIPMENYLRDMKPLHDALRPAISVSPDGSVMSTVKAESKLPPPRPEYLAEISMALARGATKSEMLDLAAKEHVIQSGVAQAPTKPKAEEKAPEPEPTPSQKALDAHARDQMERKTLAQLEASHGVYTGASGKAAREKDQGRAALNKALEKARAAQQKRGQSAVDEIVKEVEGQAVEAGYSASKVHGEAVEGLIYAIAGKRAKFDTPFDDALDALKAAGSNIEFDEDHIRDVVESKTLLGDMTPAQVENVLYAIKNLKKISMDYRDAYVGGKGVPRPDAIKDIDAALAKGTGKGGIGGKPPPPIPPVLPEGQKPGPIKRIMDFVSPARLRAETANLHNLFHVLGEWGDTYRTRFIEGMFHRDQNLHQMKDAYSPIATLKGLDEVVKMPANARAEMPVTITVGDMLHARFQTGTEEGLRDYARGWGISNSDMESWFDANITKEQMDAVKESWRRFKDVYGNYAAVHATRGEGPMKLEHDRLIFTKHGEYEGGWGGPRRMKEVPGALPDVADEVYHGNRDGEETGNQKVRVPVHSMEQFRMTLASLAHDMAFSEIARDGWQMIRDPEFRNTVLRYKGQAWLNEIEGTHELVSQGWTSQVRGSWYSDTLFPAMKARTAHASFGLNLLVTGGQIAHEPLAAFALGIHPAHVAEGLARSRTVEGQAEAMQYSKFLPQYTSNMRGQLNEMIAQATGYRATSLEILNTPSMYLQEKMSTMLARDIWHMSFAEHMDAVHDKARAGELADLDASTAMPPTNIFQQPKVVRDRTMGLFFLVRNFPATVWNLKSMLDWDTQTARSNGVPLLQARVPQIGRKLGMYGSLGFGLYLMGHGRNEEEQKQGGMGFVNAAARTLVTEATYGAQVTHMLVRDLGAAILPGQKFNVRNVHLFDSTVGELGDALVKDFDAVQKGIKSPGAPLDKSLIALADAAARLFVPGGTQMVKYVQGAKKVIDYERFHYSDFVHTPKTPVGAMGNVLAGPFRRDSTPFSDFDEGYESLFGR